MLKKAVILFSVLSILSLYNRGVQAQDLTIPQAHINELSSLKMQGRAYLKNGDKKAAHYIKHVLKSYKVGPCDKSYYQEFSFPMNTFPGKMELFLDRDNLNPVSEFVVAPECKSTKGTFMLHYLPKAADTNDTLYDSLTMQDYSGKFVVANFPSRSIYQDKPFKASGIIIPKKSFFWWASTGHSVADLPVILVSDSLMRKKPQKITLNIENKFKKKHQTQNVLAYVEGSEQPDSFLVFTAHYDHLGSMGKDNVFRGANDNASGTAMVLWMANYFSKPENKPKSSVAFLFFAAEESGLIGSSYFVNNPLIPLNKIKALINLDMVGTGSEGIAIVNGETNTRITETIQVINAKDSLFSAIKIRGESCNSDHCFFHKKGVPAVFIYTMGKEFKHYHNLKDAPETLPLTKFFDLKQLLIDFEKAY
ncbi:MAG: M28 family peptidase [Salinivirgaceae bacterium]|jgi:aminopeptidase YwaD|nr:M28 family peptidase [Salinivirgaceae bacterium]